jgi:hypothetical protein
MTLTIVRVYDRRLTPGFPSGPALPFTPVYGAASAVRALLQGHAQDEVAQRKVHVVDVEPPYRTLIGHERRTGARLRAVVR